MKTGVYRRPDDGPRPPARWMLWGTFLAAPGLWFAYFMAAYVFNEAMCGATELMAGAGAPVGTVTLVATVIVTLLVAGSTVWAWRVARRAARTRDAYDDFLPRVGFWLGLLLTIAMLAHLVQVVLVGSCA